MECNIYLHFMLTTQLLLRNNKITIYLSNSFFVHIHALFLFYYNFNLLNGVSLFVYTCITKQVGQNHSQNFQDGFDKLINRQESKYES